MNDLGEFVDWFLGQWEPWARDGGIGASAAFSFASCSLIPRIVELQQRKLQFVSNIPQLTIKQTQ